MAEIWRRCVKIVKNESRYEDRVPYVILPSREIAWHTWVGNMRGVDSGTEPCIIIAIMRNIPRESI